MLVSAFAAKPRKSGRHSKPPVPSATATASARHPNSSIPPGNHCLIDPGPKNRHSEPLAGEESALFSHRRRRFQNLKKPHYELVKETQNLRTKTKNKNPSCYFLFFTSVFSVPSEPAPAKAGGKIFSV